MIGLGFVIFSVLNHASNTHAVSNARGVAKTEVEVAMRQIVRDLSRAKAPTISEYEEGKRALTTTETSTEFFITEPNSNSSSGVDEIKVKYVWDISAKTLVREATPGGARTYSKHLKKIWIDYAEKDPEKTNVEGASGTVLVVMETEVIPEGRNPPQIHHQEMMVAIHGEMSKNVREKWRSSNDFSNSFYK
jgi:type II secretory pathway component PulJ